MIREDKLHKLRDKFVHWISIDKAVFYFGINLDLWKSNEWEHVEKLIWAGHKLTHPLFDMIFTMIELKILESSVNKDEVRWNRDLDI